MKRYYFYNMVTGKYDNVVAENATTADRKIRDIITDTHPWRTFTLEDARGARHMADAKTEPVDNKVCRPTFDETVQGWIEDEKKTTNIKPLINVIFTIMAKNEKNTNETMLNAGKELLNVEQRELNEMYAEPGNTTSDAVQETPDSDPETKAAAILRARLPHLSEKGLNFEKRTGRFFRGILEKVTEKVQDADGNEVDKTDKQGNIVFVKNPDGTIAEKMRRIVVDLADEDGNVYDEFNDEALLAEINAKRAAAFVLDEKRKERLESELQELKGQIAIKEQEIAAYEVDKQNAVEVVNATELPKREQKERATLKVKVDTLQDENAKLRAALIAAGIDPVTMLPLAK